jgi:two-component system, cell cycle sensor histidine kinase and response regulator CckA
MMPRNVADDGLGTTVEGYGALLALLDVCPHPAAVLAGDGTIMALNHSEAERLGGPVETFLTREWSTLLPSEEQALWKERIGMVAATGSSASFERAGEVETATIRLHAVEGHAGSPSGVLVLILRNAGAGPGERALPDPAADIESLREQERTARLEALGALAAGVAHDFNNHLASILANVSLAQDALSTLAKPPPLIAESLSAAERAVLGARDLTRQLLTFARGSSGSREPTSLSSIVSHAARFALSGSRHKVEVRLAPDLRPCEADPLQIARVVNNLVMNAAGRMEQAATVVVSAANCRVEAGSALPLPPGDYVRVGVSDSGPHIPIAEQANVFHPFPHDPSHETRMSLAAAYAAVIRNHGLLTLTSEPGEHTEFVIYLPAAAPARQTGPATVTAPIRGSGRILVMDDEPFLRSALLRMLTSLGYHAEGVADGDQAVKRYRRALKEGRRFDAVIMDLTIPGGRGGVEVAQKLLSLDPNLRAIASSGYVTAPAMTHYRDHGFVGRLPKPYNLQEVSRALARAFENREPAPG